MEGEIIHYLDGLPIEEPLGWLDFSEELDRDIRERIVSVKYASELTFTGGAYAYLNDLNTTQGYCRIVLYEAKQRCNGTLNTCAKGVLILADAEWNLTRCEVVVPVVDDSVGARVISNKDISISPTAEASKNGITIAPVPVVDLSIHDPQGDGTELLPDTRRTWDWFEAITHAVKYITDDTVNIVSNWYANLDDAEKWALVDGLELRVHDGGNTRVVWTFKQLFDEMAGRYNLWMLATRDASGNPLLRIEPESYFYGGPGPVMELDIQDLKRTIDSDRLYARVIVGCDNFIRQFSDIPLALPYVPLLTQGKEEYHFTGVCNTSETLELSFDFISDSNAIEDVIINGNGSYDDNIFLLQYYDGLLTPGPETSRWQFSPDGVLFVWPFNQQGLNANILNRYYLPSSVGANFGPQTAYSETTPAPLTDTLNGFNQASTPAALFATDYTAAVSEYAYFEVNVPWRIVSNTPQLFAGLPLYAAGNFQIIAERYDAANTLLQTLTFDANETAIAPGVRNFSAAFGFSLNIGDYVVISYVFTTLPGLFNGPTGVTPGTLTTVFEIPGGATIEKTFSNGGGFAEGVGPAPMLKYTFERHINLTSWLSLTGNPEQSMTISPSSTPLAFGWVANAKRNVATGATQWEVVSRP